MNDYLAKMEKYEQMKRDEAERRQKDKEQAENDQITHSSPLSHE